MSRGPGRVERAIRELFDANPDKAFTTDDLCLACYPDLRHPKYIDRKHRVAVVRAANKVAKADRDWHSTWSWTQGNTSIYYNRASLQSTAIADTLRCHANSRRDFVQDKAGDTLDPPDAWGKWGREQADRIRRRHADYLALRDASPEQVERIKAERAAELAGIADRIRAAHSGQSVVEPQSLKSDNTYRAVLPEFAARLRALITQNDPDAVRHGLREIADALDAIAGNRQLKEAA